MHLVVSLLLIGSGLTAVIADAPRWWSACLGSFDSVECAERQNDWYDVAPPGEQWVGIDTAAAFMGVSYVLMAIAALCLFRVLVPHRWSWLFGVLFAVPHGLLALSTLGAAAAGQWIGTIGSASAWWIISMLWPIALAVAGTAWLTRPETSERSRWPAVGTGALIVASPIAIYFTMSIFYMSHDTTPWTMTVVGLLTILAGVTFLRARSRAPVDEESTTTAQSVTT